MLMDSVRQTSMASAQALGYPTNPQLPLLNENAFVRPVEQVVGRILAMHCVAASAYGFDRARAVAWLKREFADQYLTDIETAFLETGAGDRQALANQVESVFALAWATGVVSKLDFATPCPNEFVSQLPNLKADQSGQVIHSKAKLRSTSEIVSAVDLAYCIHWAIRDTQFWGKKTPGKVEEYVIVERRRALEWLLTDEAWEEITLDT